MPNGQKLNIRWKIAGLVLLTGLAIPAFAGADIFVDVPGAPGESLAPFPGQIDAASISFGYNSPVDPATGKQPAVFVAPITITKALDKSSAKLMSLGGSGTRLAKVTVRNTSPVQPSAVIMTVILSDVAITDWQIVSLQGGENFEQVTFQPKSVSVEYVQMNANNTPGTKFSGSFGAK